MTAQPQGSQSARIMVIDDEPAVLDQLARMLSLEGYDVAVATCPDELRRLVPTFPPDLCIVDLTFFDSDGRPLRETGQDVIRWLRQQSQDISILIYTSTADTSIEAESLDLGADDYLRKPSPREVILARVRARLRRRNAHITARAEGSGDCYRFSGWRFRAGSRSITADDGQTSLLSYSEYDLLKILIERAGTPVDKDELFVWVLGRTWSEDDRSLDNLVKRLRRKLKDPAIIKTIYGVGYMFVPGVRVRDD